MRLKHENLRSMTLNLRSGAKVQIDQDGCAEIENEQDAQMLLATGWKATAARSPRVIPGMATSGDPGVGPLWPGGPTKAQVEDMRAFAQEAHDALHEAKESIQKLTAENSALKAEVASLKAAQGAPSAETASPPSEPAESASEAPTSPEKPRRPKGPKPE